MKTAAVETAAVETATATLSIAEIGGGGKNG